MYNKALIPSYILDDLDFAIENGGVPVAEDTGDGTGELNTDETGDDASVAASVAARGNKFV